MPNWWDEPLRAVTLEFPASDVSTIDVKGIVNETQQGHVNTLVVFSTGYYPGGTAFYQSKIAPLYPGLGGRDLLADAIEARPRQWPKGGGVFGFDLGQSRTVLRASGLGAAQSRRPRHKLGRSL